MSEEIVFDLEEALDELAKEGGNIASSFEWGFSSSPKYLQEIKARILAEFTALRERAEAAEAENERLRTGVHYIGYHVNVSSVEVNWQKDYRSLKDYARKLLEGKS